MIISHRHKFIFLKTEKTAGTSLEIALSAVCGSNDIITPISRSDEEYRSDLGYPGAQNYKFSWQNHGLKKLTGQFRSKHYRKHKLGFYNHMPAPDIRDSIDPKVWAGYFKFCFERNPFDKIVSWYQWMNKDGQYQSMREFIESGQAEKVRGREVYSIDDKIAVDQVYKFEELEAALEDLNLRLNPSDRITLPPKKTKSSGSTLSYREVLTDFEIDWIKEKYQWELDTFDYKF